MRKKVLFYLMGCCWMLLSVHCGVYPSWETERRNKNYYEMDPSIPIMGRGRATTEQLIAFFSATHKPFDYSYVRQVIQTYIQESSIEGVNSDVAFCQMCIETNYLRFGGQVQQSQNNFCGLGATDGGARGETFESIRLGVRAHIQHLKAYASTKPLNRRTVDPRFDGVHRGSVVTIQGLSGTWASDPQYGYKIAQKLYELNQYL